MNSDDMDGSSFSSFYSSFIKTTDSSDSPHEQDNKESKPANYQVKTIIINILILYYFIQCITFVYFLSTFLLASFFYQKAKGL